jgi:hypothetical protein
MNLLFFLIILFFPINWDLFIFEILILYGIIENLSPLLNLYEELNKNMLIHVNLMQSHLSFLIIQLWNVSLTFCMHEIKRIYWLIISLTQCGK